MTAAEFQKMALSLPETAESAHMDHPDFRVRGKIFATLPLAGKGMVKLTPEQQVEFVHDHPETFEPVQGGWGRRGATYVNLKSVKKAVLHRAMLRAWRNTAPRNLAGPYEE
ncbi:MAG TPA: MmcQ/YjbR family DNA-binding protein [Bryobacteraceae bacterium]|jgi:hypothetical protein